MPCDGSYMEPNEGELSEGREHNIKVKRLADRLTHDLDMIREWILAGMENNPAMYAKVMENHEAKLDTFYAERDQMYYMVPIRLKLYSLKELESLVNEHSEYRTKVSSSKPFATVRIEKRQIAHRKKDLDRLLITFAKGGVGKETLIQKVLKADPNKPLTPQLGFDPDDF